MNLVIFLIISLIAVVFSLLVVTANRIMHSVLALAGMLLSVAAIYATLGAEFLAVIQVLVYAGGVIVLFIFATMLTKSDLQLRRELGDEVKPAAAIVFFIGVIFYLATNPWSQISGVRTPGSIVNVGGYIFNLKQGVIPFEILSLVLLAAMVGAIFLGKKEVNS